MYGGYCTRNDLSHVALNRYKRVLKENILKSWRAKINIFSAPLQQRTCKRFAKFHHTSYMLRVSLRRRNILQLFNLMFSFFFSIHTIYGTFALALFKVIGLSLLLLSTIFFTKLEFIFLNK